jgi:hypothetical protein
MKTSIFLTLLLLTCVVYARRGPMPQERTDVPGMKNSTTGRYMYVGDVPKFEAQELEFTLSKMNLTNRVTAYVNQGKIDTYATQLFFRWKNIDDAFSDPIVSLHPLVRLSKLAENKPLGTQAWARIAEQYSSHILEKSQMDIYLEKRNARNYVSNEIENDYKRVISDAYFRYLFDVTESADLIINDNLKLAQILSPENSERLFKKHLGHLYTASADKPGYIGYLTFVYPIAATVEGPFDQPREQITDMKTEQSIEARWWSNKWQDEFGGFPFLLLEWSGVAFHGPITNYAPMDVWFLRRGYVSHGCHRMDGSDVLELRALMPLDLKKAAGKIKVTILDHFDVVDWNKDGTLEAIDVKYYSLPTAIAVPKGKTVEDVIKPYLIENQQSSYLKNNKYAAKFFDATSDKLKKIPKYVFGNKTVKKSGVHEIMDIYRFDNRPNRILQYTEDGHKLQGFDDSFGKYPPKSFQRY